MQAILDLGVCFENIGSQSNGIQLWGNALSNKCVTFFTDNSGVGHIINKQSYKDPTIMKLVRKFVVLTLQFNILFNAVHIPV
jgi:hypothetical protein